MLLLNDSRKEIWRKLFGKRNPSRMVAPVVENKQKTIEAMEILFAKACCSPALGVRKITRGKRWMHVMKCKRKYIVVEGVSGRDWVDVFFAHGMHKRTRGAMMAAMFKKRKEVENLKNRMRNDYDLMDYTGDLWQRWCVDKKKESFEEMYRRERKLVLQEALKVKLQRSRNGS